jgi:hypothetical protein
LSEVPNQITDIILNTPHIFRGRKDWDFLRHPWNYPLYELLGKILSPTSVLEFGTLLGWSLISLLNGSDNLDRIVFVDNESYTKQSNKLALENINWYLDKYKNGKRAHIEAFYSKYVLINRYPLQKYANTFDLIHVDGDHKYEGVMEDLNLTYSYNPKFILIDDMTHVRNADVRVAVDDWASYLGLEYILLDSFGGIAFIDLSKGKEIQKWKELLVDHGIPLV